MNNFFTLTVHTRHGGKERLGYYNTQEEAEIELKERFGLKIASITKCDAGTILHLEHPLYNFATLVE